MVWAKSWRVTCLPFLLWISCLASAILFIYNEWLCSHGKVAKAVLFAETQSYRFLVQFYTCNIATNIYSTCTIWWFFLLPYPVPECWNSCNCLPNHSSYQKNWESKPLAPNMSHPHRIWGSLHLHKRPCLGCRSD